MNLSRIKSKFGITKLINKIDKTRGSRTKWLGSKEILALISVMIILSLIVVFMLKWSAFGKVLGICLLTNSVVAFFGWYRFITTKSKNIFLEILTVFGLIFVALFYTPVILIFYIYNRITQRINLKYLSRNIELFLLLILLFMSTAAFVFVESEHYAEQALFVKLCYIFAIIKFNILKRVLVWMFARGRKKAYTRYKINQELKYIGEFLVSIFLLIRQLFDQKDIELLLSVFLIISALSAIKSVIINFKGNIKQINCVHTILTDLENCVDCLSSENQNTKLRIRFLIDTTSLVVCFDGRNKKLKNAIQSIFDLVFSEEVKFSDQMGCKNTRSLVHRPYTYNCTVAELQTRIGLTLDEIARALMALK